MFRSRPDGKLTTLRAHPALTMLSDDELEHLAGLADVIDVPAGRLLMEEDGFGGEVFLLLEGEARVLKHGEQLAILGPGQFVGEMALLDHHPRSATVETTAPVRALVFDPRAFDQMVVSNRALIRQLLQQVTSRLRTIEDVGAASAR